MRNTLIIEHLREMGHEDPEALLERFQPILSDDWDGWECAEAIEDACHANPCHSCGEPYHGPLCLRINKTEPADL